MRSSSPSTNTPPASMISAIISSGPSVNLIDGPLPPLPLPTQLLVRTIFASSNPKDWKRPTLMKQAPGNQGDDVAGIVVAVGENVTNFKIGDRVAGLHQPGTDWGTYAEFCLLWSHAAFLLPEDFDLAEASTFPMAAMTAAVGLYRTLGLPLPEPSESSASTWGTSTKAKPLIIYGASSAVGAFAVKLAHLSGVHPIIAIAGAGSAYVRTLLDEKLGDVVLDYRRGEEELLRGVSSALNTNGLVAAIAFDAVPDVRSQSLLGKLLMSSESISGHEIKHIASVLPLSKVDDFPEEKVKRTFVMSPIIFQSNEIEGADKEANRAFGKKVMEFFGTAVQAGTLRGHPYEIIAGGLRGIQLGLENLQRGKNSAMKYVYEIGKQ